MRGTTLYRRGRVHTPEHPAATALVVAVIGLNLLGDGLRAAMDPRGADE